MFCETKKFSKKCTKSTFVATEESGTSNEAVKRCKRDYTVYMTWGFRLYNKIDMLAYKNCEKFNVIAKCM